MREYDALRSPSGALAAGSVSEVTEKLLMEHELFGHDRYIAQMSVGAVAHRGRDALDRAVRDRGRASGPGGGARAEPRDPAPAPSAA